MLKLDNVCKLFNPGSPDEKVALLGIDLELNAGDFVTIIGSNGAGKSTLMNIISGVMKPDLGKRVLRAARLAIWRNISAHAGSAGSSRTRWPGLRRI